jgi:hypothetical protein
MVWRQVDKGPKFAKLGRRVVYRLADLEKFIAARMVEPFDGRKHRHRCDDVIGSGVGSLGKSGPGKARKAGQGEGGDFGPRKSRYLKG